MAEANSVIQTARSIGQSGLCAAQCQCGVIQVKGGLEPAVRLAG